MVAVEQTRPGQTIGSADQRVTLHNVPWSHYEILLAIKGEAAVPRITYLEGELELMSPSQDHEGLKKLLARLLEMYAFERDLPLQAYGSWTVRIAPKKRGIEPDECYVMGDPTGRDRPDLAIEINWTSGGIDKLAVYAGLEVDEVWMWHDGVIEIYLRSGDRYERVERSSMFPELDVALITRLLGYADHSKAVRELVDTLRA